MNEAENLKTFYCPSRQPKCSYKRDQRCTTAKVCLNPAGKEEGCEEATSPGRYEIFRGKSYIASFAKSSRDRKKRSVEDIKHWYLQYRGFVYEFGKPYGVQELDINDPNYKYGPGGTKKATWTMEGTSSCARGPVITVARCFEKLYDYDLLCNNCQDFYKTLFNLLEDNCSEMKDVKSPSSALDCDPYRSYISKMKCDTNPIMSSFWNLAIALCAWYGSFIHQLF